MKYTKLLRELSRNDAAIAGGKGASLGEMLNAGIPVPDGYVVLSTTFDKFIEDTDLVQEIDAILDSVNHKEIHTVEGASDKIKGLILSREMPHDIAEEIKTNFKSLGTKFVAVRSSATAEDGAEHAWAGQLESYLNTTDKDLLEKVKHCWASLFTPRAIFYRFEKGLHSTRISVAVVVQKMVESEVSGIAFSVHPVTEDRNQLIIEAGFGLGEAIVSGSVTPDSYVVEKIPRRVIDKNISTQERGLFRVETGGNEWRNIDEPKASSQVLDEKQIFDLSEIIVGIENHYGFPCDIEWAYEKGKFYIVQSRPITTLSAIVEKKDSNDINADNGATRIVEDSNTKSEFIKKNLNFGKFPNIETYKSKDEILKNYKNYILENKKWYPKGIKSKLLFMAPQGISAAAGVSSVHKIGFKIGIATYVDEYMKWSYDPRDFKQIGEDLIEQNIVNPNWIEEYGNKFWTETNDFIKKADDIFWNFDSDDLFELRNKFVDIVNSSIRAQSYGYITEVFTLTDEYWVSSYIKKLAPNLSDDDIATLLQPSTISFVKKYQIDLSLSKTREDLKLIQRKYYWVKGSYFAQPLLTLDMLSQEKATQKIEEFEHPNKEKIIVMSQGGVELRRFLSMIERFIAIQDERKANVLRLNYSLVKICTLLSNIIKSWEVSELFDLTPEEILLLIDDQIDQNYKGIISERNHKSVWIFANEGYYITSLESEFQGLINLFDDKNDNTDIKGYKASGGFVKGPVKIVLSENDFHKISRGDILVTSMTRPEFMPVLEKAVAFITDEGGITCHAAIVSRELKKPCIIGTKIATKVLKDGDMVEVDADKGVVRIVNVELEKKDLADEYLERIGNRKLYPPLNGYSAFLQGSEYNIEKYFGKWYENKVRYDFFLHMKEGYSQVWLPEDDIRGASDFGLREYLNKSKSFDRRIDFMDESIKYIDKIYTQYTYEKIDGTKLDKLFLLVNEVRDIIWDVNAAVSFSIFFDKKMCENILIDEKYPITSNEINILWDKAVTPAFESFDKVQLSHLLTLMSKSIKWESVLEECQYFLTDYHSAKTLSEVEKALKERYKKYIDEPGSTKNALKTETEEVDKMIHEHKKWLETLPENEKKIANYLQTVMKVRDRRKNFFAKGMTIMYRVAEKVFKEAGVDRNLIPFYTIRELLKGVEHLKSSVDDLKDRKNGFQWLVPYSDQPKKQNINIDSGVQKINNYFKECHLSDNNSSEIQGQCAYKGVIKGRVRIVLNVNSNHGFSDDEVLVAGMTRPEYVPLMKKAAAIITDEGGITCHAAIVSRELKIPCIIGTKIATKVLKDGDMVEVDADKGVVKIIK